VHPDRAQLAHTFARVVGSAGSQRTGVTRPSNRSRRTGKSAKSLSIQIGKEKRRRRKLEAEVNDVKAQLSQLYDTLGKKG